MESYLTYVTVHWDDLLLIFTSMVTTFSVIARLTPNKSDDAIIDKILGVVNFFALNKRK